jgi:hypothetical protein
MEINAGRSEKKPVHGLPGIKYILGGPVFGLWREETLDGKASLSISGSDLLLPVLRGCCGTGQLFQ